MDTNFSSKFDTKPPSRFKALFNQHKKYILLALPVVIIAGALVWYFRVPNPDLSSPNIESKKVEAKPTVVPSLLNGVMVASEVANRHPVAVMIENSQPARPQVGLTSADIVYEAVTEGGITRFMGVFSQTYPTKAGPVRSARSYFIDWLSEYDAFYAHVGGSPTALQRIRDYGIKDAGGFNAYHREPKAGVATEHTDFVDVQKIFDLGVAKGWPTTYDTASWLFKDPAAAATATGPVTIDFSSAPFKVVWKFDTTANEYARELAGAAHRDRETGDQIKAKTIVVMVVQNSSNGVYKTIAGHEAEWTMNTIASGKLTVFEDGTKIDGTWSKTSRTERTRFLDANGKEIPLNRGKIWVEIVPQTGSYSVAAAPAA